MTNLQDARVAVEVGCDALGFVFYKKSPRYIDPHRARAIIRQLPKSIIKVGLFVNTKETTIKNIAELCGLDILQFHGNEADGFCRKFKDYKIIKAFRIKDSLDLRRIIRYDVFAYLFDTYVKSRPGGTGRSFDWRLLKDIKTLPAEIFLSGGLNSKNVKEAIKSVHPDWVDVCSSIELRLGKKDQKKVKEFIRAVKE